MEDTHPLSMVLRLSMKQLPVVQPQLYMNNIDNNKDPVVYENLAGIEFDNLNSQSNAQHRKTADDGSVLTRLADLLTHQQNGTG